MFHRFVVAGRVTSHHRLRRMLLSPQASQRNYSVLGSPEPTEKKTSLTRNECVESAKSFCPDSTTPNLTKKLEDQFSFDNLPMKKNKEETEIAKMGNLMANGTKHEAENLEKFAIQNFAMSLLDIADSLAMVSSNYIPFSLVDTSHHIDSSVLILNRLLQEVVKTNKQLKKVFEKFGVNRFAPYKDELFDPDRHHPVYQLSWDGFIPYNSIALVRKHGYIFDDRVLRKADVWVVESESESDQDGSEAEENNEAGQDGSEAEENNEDDQDGSEAEENNEADQDGSEAEENNEAVQDGSEAEENNEADQDGSEAEENNEGCCDGSKAEENIEADQDGPEAENLEMNSVQNFVKSLLDIADTLTKVSMEYQITLSSTEDMAEALPVLKRVLEDVVVADKQLKEVFKKFEIERFIPGKEPFDPHRHITVDIRGDFTPGYIKVVVKPGYMLHDRVIRRAIVFAPTRQGILDDTSWEDIMG